MPEPPDAIARIDALTNNARNTWFALLGVLVFVGITLMGVEHIDFYGVDRATQLPLVNVEVPTRFFFIAAPILTAAIFGYFHLYLIRLWDALSVAEPRTGDDRPLGDVIAPWLVTDAALHLRAWFRRDGCTTRRPMESMAMLLNFGLAWCFGLCVMLSIWWASMPARELLMTTVAGAALLVSTFTGSASLAMAVSRMRAPRSNDTTNIFSTVPAMSALLVLVPAVLLSGYQRTSGSIPHLAPINLQNQNIVNKPHNWLRRDHAEREFRAIWCKREAVEACDLGELKAEYEAEWNTRRNDAISALRKPRFNKVTRIETFSEASVPNASVVAVLARRFREGANLRGANLQNAFLSGANLRAAQLQQANLSRAEIEGAVLFFANLSEANLVGANLVGGDLRNTNLNSANLSSAKLTKAQLLFADLKNAALENAHLQGAVLWRASLQGANLTRVRMQGANLGGAQLQEVNARWANLEEANLRSAQIQGADLFAAQFNGADLSQAQAQGADLRWTEFQRTFLLGSQLQNTNLTGSNLHRALLAGADLQGADLAYSFLTGTLEVPNNLRGSKFMASTNYGGAVRFVNLTHIEFDAATDFRNAFLDGSVSTTAAFASQMGGDLERPCQWWPDPLPDAEFYGRWRGWIEHVSRPDLIGWMDVAPEGWRDVATIPPPEGCEWKTGPMPGADAPPDP